MDSPLEGTGFEPSVPLLRKAHLGVANRRRRRERQSHLQVQVRTGNACLEWLPTAYPFAEGPQVRIRLPPAGSLVRTRFRGGIPFRLKAIRRALGDTTIAALLGCGPGFSSWAIPKVVIIVLLASLPYLFLQECAWPGVCL